MKSKLLLKILIPVLAVILIAGLGVLYVNSKLDKLNYQSEATVSAEPTETPASTGDERSDLTFELPNEEEKQTDGGIINILLLGTDRRLEGTSDPGRADCNMLCSLNKDTGEIKLISFERGIYVPIPENLMPYGGTSDLLTHAYHWGGADLSQSIISECFNLDLAGYAQVDFDTFQAVVDAIGGIDIEITQIEAYSLNKHFERHFEAGVEHFNGAEALEYARTRSIDDDWLRQQRQRNTIKACLNKIKSLSLSELNSLADVVLPLINTNLSKTQIASLLLSAPKFLGSEVSTLQVPDKNMTESHYIQCDFEYESKKISNFIYGTDYELVCPYTNPKEYMEGHTKDE